MGLAILVDASLPIKFWVGVFLNVVHVINVLPTTLLNKNNLHEMLFNEKHDYI